MDLLESLRAWGFAALGGAVVLVALLVNWLAPTRRKRLRTVWVLYALTLLLVGLERIVEASPAASVVSWAEHAHLVAGLLAAFTTVSAVSLLVFDVLLPAIGVHTLAITGDVVVGFAYVFAALGVLKAEGVAASSVVTTSAVASGVLALSLQTTLGNILGGVALQLDGSVNIGDWLQLPDGQQGKVVAIRWRHTVLETRNWDTIIVPNASLLAQNILILGKRTGQPVQHRMWVYFNVDFRFAPSHVIEVVRDALSEAPIENVSDNPRPDVICYDFARDGRDSFGYYAVRYWLVDLLRDDPTNSRMRTRIYSALKRAGIPLARPAQTLFINPEEDENARAERHKEGRLAAIQRVQLFQPLTPAELAFVADHVTYAPFTAGETITHQGATAHWLYVLCSGKVEVRRRAENADIVRSVNTIEAPSFFGEMGLLAGEPRRADVVALTDVDCYRLDRSALEQLLRERPEIAAQMSRTLAEREVELEAVVQHLDEEARRARVSRAETRILDKIQEFFGLERTTRA
jgi:small-conductance mechanosensitive channel/CRP-like cAMP-binding protein